LSRRLACCSIRIWRTPRHAWPHSSEGLEGSHSARALSMIFIGSHAHVIMPLAPRARLRRRIPLPRSVERAPFSCLDVSSVLRLRLTRGVQIQPYRYVVQITKTKEGSSRYFISSTAVRCDRTIRLWMFSSLSTVQSVSCHAARAPRTSQHALPRVGSARVRVKTGWFIIRYWIFTLDSPDFLFL
jgi:hypothetical protein